MKLVFSIIQKSMTNTLFNVGLVLAISIFLPLMGCSLLINEMVKGDEIEPLGDDTYRVTYDGYGAEKLWMNSCRKLCGGGDFTIISQQQISRPQGIPGWTGIIKCKTSAVMYDSEKGSYKFVPEKATEETVRMILDDDGSPIDDWVLNDNVPVAKILFYKRGDLVHSILFTYDDVKGVFVYQAIWGWKKGEFDNKKDTPEYKKSCEEWYANELARRAFQYEKAGKVDLQYKYIQQIEKVSPISAFAYNSVAWFYAACPNPEYRNGQKAVTFGEKSVSMERNCYNLDSLAAAYAEVGDFDKAVQLQNEAISLCTDQKRKAEYSEVLGGYQNHKRRYQLAQ